MGYFNTLNPSRKNWLGLFVKVAILGIVMVARVNSDDQTSLLCISDCATCPVICSPPPSPVKPRSPPPLSPPPPPLLTPIYQFPPLAPKSHDHSPPPPLPPVPSSNIPWIAVPTPPSSSNNPPSGHSPLTAGPRDYAYPYYYFYASKASNLCIHTSTFVLLLLFLVLYFS